MVYYEVTSRRRLGGRCFSLSQDFCSSRDGESRPRCSFLTIDSARINPKTRGGWHLRVRTRRLFFKPSGFVSSQNCNIQFLSAQRSALLHFQAPVALRKVRAVTSKRAQVKNPRAIVQKSPFATGRLFDGGGSFSFMDGPHLSQSVARMPFRDLIDGYMKHRSLDTCDSSTASPSARSRSGSDATFEVPVPVPKRAKRAPTPSSTPPRAAAVPKTPDSPFLPIKLP